MVKEKYSVGEFERRFLLSDVPPDASDPRRITDHYLDGTRLRLRLVEVDGGVVDRKLGHKRRVDDGDPTAIRHTTLYLDGAEYDVLAGLPGRRLTKTRWAIDANGRAGSINVFEEALAGLIMLEVDLGSAADLDGYVPPPWAGTEVTTDEAFTGGRLAGGRLADLPAPFTR